MNEINNNKKFEGIIVDVSHSEYKNDDKSMMIEKVSHPGGVCVAAMIDEGKLLLVKQYRFGVDEELIEFPAGLIDPDEDPKDTALRELREETGYEAGEIIECGKLYLSPGYSNEITYLYFAKDLTFVGYDFDENEEITQVTMTPDELIQLCNNHSISDAKTVALAYKLKTLRQL